MIFGSLGSSLELLAQAADLRVDAAVETCGRTAARQIEKLIAIEHALRSLDQRDQQIVFAGAQRHRDAVIAKERARADVQSPAVEMVALGRCSGSPFDIFSWLRRSTALIRAISSRLPNGFGR